MLGTERKGSCWRYHIGTLLWCYFSKYSTPLVCYTAGDGVPSSASALGLHKGMCAGKQEGASTVPEPLQHTNLHPPKESGFWLGPCASFIVGLFIFRWPCCSIVTQLVSNWPGKFCSPVLLAGRTTKSGGFMCPDTHAGAVREGSSRGEEVFADRCLCLKCPCVFRPWSIGAWEHSALGKSILLSPGYVK